VRRTSPTRGFLAREQHRVLLTIHALLMISGLLACAVLNRRLSPDHLWVQWVALAWFALFVVHLWIFSRGTLATMGGRRSSAKWPSSPR
jgi:hypothetical protein